MIIFHPQFLNCGDQSRRLFKARTYQASTLDGVVLASRRAFSRVLPPCASWPCSPTSGTRRTWARSRYPFGRRPRKIGRIGRWNQPARDRLVSLVIQKRPIVGSRLVESPSRASDVNVPWPYPRTTSMRPRGTSTASRCRLPARVAKEITPPSVSRPRDARAFARDAPDAHRVDRPIVRAAPRQRRATRFAPVPARATPRATPRASRPDD